MKFSLRLGGRSWAVVALALLSSQLASFHVQVSALPSGQIGVLYVGDVVRIGSFAYLNSDPLFQTTFVEANLRGFGGLTLDQVRRAVRLYMPHSHTELASHFDVIVLNDADVEAVGTPNIEMFTHAVRKDGLGLLMTGGWSSFGGVGSAADSWGSTSIGELLPTDCIAGIWLESGRVVIDAPSNEFMKSLPWRTGNFMKRWDHNLGGAEAGGPTACPYGKSPDRPPDGQLGHPQ